MDIPFIFNKPIIIPPDPVPVRDPRLDDFAYYNGPQGSGAVAGSGGSNPLPPLPWPTQPVGAPPGNIPLGDDYGNILTDSFGNILTTDIPETPPLPTFELPQPPPPDIPQLEELEGEP